MDTYTTREKIIEILRRVESPISVDELARMIGADVDPKMLYDDLVHVSKTIRTRSGGREFLAMEPPVCRKCGYIFKELTRPRKPSRCPRCKSEWISPPRFIILRKS